jgi:addiction module HigA family antidote
MKDPALNPVHPGEILSEEFLKPLELSQYRLAKEIGVPPRRINEIILGKRGVTADTALRLGHYLGTTPDVWMNLQTRYELDSKRLALGKLIACLPRFAAAMA